MELCRKCPPNLQCPQSTCQCSCSAGSGKVSGLSYGRKADQYPKERLPGKEVIPHLMPAFESHLRRKGWLDKTLFHIRDEPTIRNALSWKEISSYIHQFAPDLRRIDAIETTFMFDEIEIAVPKLEYVDNWNEDFIRAAEEGTEVWFYTVGIYMASNYPNKTIDVPMMDSRIMHWMNYLYDLKGYLQWGWNQWHTDDPYQDVGMHLGDGWHVYPVKDGVLNSLRWEQLRNGLQDYEYFWMLEQRISNLRDSLGSRFSWIEPKRRGKEIMNQVLKSLDKYNSDHEIFYSAKKEVIKELLDFDSGPMVYVQTKPSENTSLHFRSFVEIYGLTEPGTNIIINGKEIPVSKQGQFLEVVSLQADDIIKIQATNEKGTKEIVRRFSIIR